MDKIYLLVFDPYKTDASKLHELIKNNQHISNWWHYLGSGYLIKSRYTLNTIHNDILREWPNQRYLLIEVNPNNENGWLPREAWDWIHQHR